jgi:hypothetical protein
MTIALNSLAGTVSAYLKPEGLFVAQVVADGPTYPLG